MIGLTWRQFRTQAVVAIAALAAVAGALAITGPRLVHLYDTTVATCSTRGDCDSVLSAFTQNYPFLQTFGTLLVVVPGLLGIFWGAPLVARELETGTFRLAWTQSVTRTRWLAVKLGLVGLASMVAAGLFSLMVTWWSSPLDRVTANRFGSGAFGQRGIVPIGYAAFAFALGVTAGLLIRRTVPAMAATLVAFTAVRMAMTYWVRPRLMTPLHQVLPLDPTAMGFGRTGPGPDMLMPNPPNIANAWIYSTDIVDKAGHSLTNGFLVSTCPNLTIGAPAGGSNGGATHTRVVAGVQAVLQDCVRKVGVTYHELVTYQPASRYWPYQWAELAVFLGLALALAGLCFWWIRRRPT